MVLKRDVENVVLMVKKVTHIMRKRLYICIHPMKTKQQLTEEAEEKRQNHLDVVGLV